MTTTERPTQPAEPLLQRGFVAWLASATAAATGDGVLFFALAWTATGHGADVATVVMVAALLPEVTLTLLGGTAADRWGVRRTVAGSALAMCLVLAGFAVAARALPASVWLLVSLGLAQGVVDAFHRPASGVMPRLFVPEPLVPRAMALTGTVLQLARVAGPPLGAVVVVSIGLGGALLVDVAGFLAVALVLMVVRPAYEPAREVGNTRTELVAGLRAVREVPGVVALLTGVALLAGGLLPMLTLGVPLLVRSRGWDAGVAGVVEGCWVAAGLAVSLVVARVGTRDRVLAPLVGGPLLSAVGAIGLVAAPEPYVASAAAGLMGVGTVLFTSHVFPLLVLKAPESMLARFQSALIVVQMVAVLVGNLVLGSLAEALSPVVALLVGAGLCALAAVPAAVGRTFRSTPPG